MALTKITSRILDSSGVTTVGTISTGVWQGTAINQTYLVGQSGTNTGDETLARINALDITELGTISSGVWNGTAIDQTYLVGQSGTNTGDQTTISGNAGTVTNGVYTVGNQTIGGVKTFSSNVGIGTTSPDLGSVSGTRVLTIASPTAERWGILELAGNRTYGGNQVGELKFISTDATNNGTLVSLTAINDTSATGTGGSLKFNTRANGGSLAERMRISPDGKVGIGTTTMHQDLNLISSSTSQSLINIGTSNSSRFLNVGVSGSAGYVMMENAAALNIGTGGVTRFSISSGGVVNVNTTGSGTQKLQVIGGIQNWYDTNFNRSTKVGYDGIYISGAQHGYLLSPQDWVFYAGGVEKMRIASGGQVAIGTGTNTTKFRVLQSATGEWTTQFINTGTEPYGVSIDTSANTSNAYSFAIYTNSNTGLFVKNNARVGIGTTNPSSTLHVSGTIKADASATADNPLIVVSDTGGGLVTFQRSSAYTQMYMSSTTSGNQFYVRSQGSGGVVLATGGTSWGNGSDARLKKNFETTQGLSEVLQIEPIKYHLKTQDNSETKKLGFKAQNLQTVIPEMILDMDEEDPEDGSKYLGIIPDYLFPVLVKAIQEQQTIIEDLKSRIETLEG